MFISDPVNGHHYVAWLNPKATNGGGHKGTDMLLWSLVPRVFDGKIIRVPSSEVPRPIWKRAYRLLIEQEEWK